MRNFIWKDSNCGMEKEENREESVQGKKKHTRLVIDEDSIYEIDLDCMECREREKRRGVERDFKVE